MVKRLIYPILVILFCVRCGFAEATPSNTVSPPGFDSKERVNQLTDIVNRAFEHSREEMPSRMSGMIDSIMHSEAFRPGSLYLPVIDRINKFQDKQRLEQISKWYQSPLGHKFAQAKTRLSTPEAQKALNQAYSPNQSQTAALIQQLEQTEGITSSAADLFNSIMQAARQSMRSSHPSFLGGLFGGGRGGRRGGSRGGGSGQDRMAMMRSAIQDTTNSNMLYEYRDFTDEELKQVLTFLKSDPGKSYLKVFHDGFAEALSKAQDSAR